MADVGVVYTLTTPGTDITFNQYTEPFTGHDQFYITEIRGLEYLASVRGVEVSDATGQMQD